MVKGEEEGAEAEGGDGDSGALPAVVVVGGGDSEAEVDGVAWKGVVNKLVGVLVNGGGGGGGGIFLPVCMLTKLPQMKTLLLSRRPVMM
jgi:hypothetical protein